MKLVQTEKTLKTNADFTSQDFQIGDASKIIEILRNKMYKHNIRTLVQEYICNARDAMREINSTDKIEVTLPTMFEPTFKVRDFGPGITPDRMINVFIRYGSSTKDQSNTQTGGFGIGAKSAWSYTESFTIVTFIDGIQRTYIAHIGANNNGRLDYLGESPTDAANGTEIQIAVSPSDINQFKKSALRVVYFWQENEKPIFKNLTNDQTIERTIGDTLDNLEVNNNIPECVVSKYDEGVIFAIDGIPYVADRILLDKVASLRSLSRLVVGRMIIHIDNGQLEVTASREEISDSKYTLEHLDKIGKESLKLVNDKLVKEFSQAKTPFDHLSIYMGLKDKYNLENYRKCGDIVVNDKNALESDLFNKVKIDNCSIKPPQGTLYKETTRGSRRYYRKNHIDAKHFKVLYFVDGTETMLVTNYRIKSLLATHSNVIVFSKLETDAGEFDKLKKALGLKDLKNISYVKPQRQSRETIKIERTKQEFCIHDMSRSTYSARNISLETNTDKWLYVERTDKLDKSALRELSDWLHDKQGFKICALSKDSMKRVKGDKNFKPLADFLKNYKATAADIASLKYETAKNTDMINRLKNLTGIKDKFLNKMVAEYNTHKYNGNDVPAMLKSTLGKVDDVENFKKLDAELTTELTSKYGLLYRIYPWPNRTSDLSEIVCYINAK